jgi:polysaccharide pyruvyl transferase WcaK-like protein
MEADVTADVPIKRIRVENNSRHHLNVGDVAMLQVAVNRLRNTFPEAEIQIPSALPDRLLGLCPDVQVLNVSATSAGVGASIIPLSLPLAWRLQKHVGSRLDNVFSRFPHVWRLLAESFRAASPGERKEITDYLDELGSADLVVAPGGGYFNDTFASGSHSIFMALLLASGSGKAVGLVGQGLGPVTDRALIRLGRTLFPRLSFLGLREGRASLKLAESMGADSSRTVVTGDDALELGYTQRKETLGSKIGFNFRLASYSQTTREMADTIRDAVSIFSTRCHVGVVPVPISRQPWEDDLEAFRTLFPARSEDFGGASVPVTPAAIISLVSDCRVVVTSSYHAGVFALSQGIPILAVAKSQYYIDKFQGLGDQFGRGVRIVSLNNSDTAVLVASIEELWHSAPGMRAELLTTALAHIEKGREFYRSLRRVVADRR